MLPPEPPLQGGRKGEFVTDRQGGALASLAMLVSPGPHG